MQKFSLLFIELNEKNLIPIENAIPRIIGLLKKFIVNTIKIIAINVNLIPIKVAFFPQNLQGKFIEEVTFSHLYYSME